MSENLHARNPEEIVEEGLVSELFDKVPLEVAAANLAKALMSLDSVSLVAILEEFHSRGDHDATAKMTEVTRKRIMTCPADKLDEIVAKARQNKAVWHLVRPAVMERNDLLAARVASMEAREMSDFLMETATGNKWVPRPIREAAINRLRELALEADDIEKLDEIGRIAEHWRMRSEVVVCLKRRMTELQDSIEKLKKGWGWSMASADGNVRLMVDNPIRVLRMLASGYRLES